MPVMLRALALAAPLTILAMTCLARADAPPPSQALATDPAPPRPTLGVSAEAGGILLGDYAARIDVLVLPALSAGAQLGVSHRRETDDALAELSLVLWCLGQGLEGPFVSVAVGLAWAGPWTQQDGWTVRSGGEAGWQFLWESLSITLGGGIHAAWREDGQLVPEPRIRVALGFVL